MTMYIQESWPLQTTTREHSQFYSRETQKKKIYVVTQIIFHVEWVSGLRFFPFLSWFRWKVDSCKGLWTIGTVKPKVQEYPVQPVFRCGSWLDHIHQIIVFRSLVSLFLDTE